MAHALTEKWSLLQSSRQNLEEMERTVTMRTRELQVSEQRFRKISAHAPVGIFETDSAGAVTYTNPRLQMIMGLTQNETLGDGWKGSIHPEDAPRFFAFWRNVISEGKEASFEFRYRTPAGKVHWVYLHSTPLRSEEAFIFSALGFRMLSCALKTIGIWSTVLALARHSGSVAPSSTAMEAP